MLAAYHGHAALLSELAAAGTGIAFRAKPALREVADVVLDGASL
ncbi:hypothetical protein ABZ546_15730 [Brachybacterium paraconglomeratum]